MTGLPPGGAADARDARDAQEDVVRLLPDPAVFGPGPGCGRVLKPKRAVTLACMAPLQGFLWPRVEL